MPQCHTMPRYGDWCRRRRGHSKSEPIAILAYSIPFSFLLLEILPYFSSFPVFREQQVASITAPIRQHFCLKTWRVWCAARGPLGTKNACVKLLLRSARTGFWDVLGVRFSADLFQILVPYFGYSSVKGGATAFWPHCIIPCAKIWKMLFQEFDFSPMTSSTSSKEVAEKNIYIYIYIILYIYIYIKRPFVVQRRNLKRPFVAHISNKIKYTVEDKQRFLPYSFVFFHCLGKSISTILT